MYAELCRLEKGAKELNEIEELFELPVSKVWTCMIEY
jgi:hypothetical protein